MSKPDKSENWWLLKLINSKLKNLKISQITNLTSYKTWQIPKFTDSKIDKSQNQHSQIPKLTLFTIVSGNVSLELWTTFRVKVYHNLDDGEFENL